MRVRLTAAPLHGASRAQAQAIQATLTAAELRLERDELVLSLRKLTGGNQLTGGALIGGAPRSAASAADDEELWT